MFCRHCGNQIDDNSKICPFCSKELSSSNTDSVKNALKKTTETIVDSAKVIGNSVNEATDGQAQKYAEKAKETAQDFIGDVKQVAKDKDTSNFFTKNKYRNVKIIAVLLVAIVLINGIFGGDSKGEKMVRNIVSSTYIDCDIKSVKKITEGAPGSYYVVKLVPDGDIEHSALVFVGKSYEFCKIYHLYSINNYDELNNEIELLKMLNEQ